MIDITNKMLVLSQLIQTLSKTSKPKLQLKDYQFLYKFKFLAIDFFNSAVTSYLSKYGVEKRDELLQKIYDIGFEYCSFFIKNKDVLDKNNIYKLAYENNKFYLEVINETQNKLGGIYHEYSNINGKLESKCWSLPMEHPEMKQFLFEKKILKKEINKLENERDSLVYEHRKKIEKDSQVAYFNEVFKIIGTIVEVIKKDYYIQDLVFKRKISADSLEYFNELFYPDLTITTTMEFLNCFDTSNKSFTVKNRENTNACFLIYQISNLISDEKRRLHWESVKVEQLNLKNYKQKRTTCFTKKIKSYTEKIISDLQ